jgi:hypothetical protein
MNRQEIINKIREIFGMVQTDFSLYKTKDGVELRVDELAMENEIYIITPEGELPAPDGDVELEDGTRVQIAGGMIKKLEVVEEEKVEEVVEEKVEDETDMEEHEDEDKDEEKMAEATLVDGTIVETDGELVEGVELYVKTEEGRQPAPDGEHETTDGMVVVVEDGKVVEIKEKEVVEEEEVKVEEVMETFMDALTTLSNEIAALKQQNEELNNKFSAFKAEPAGEKIYDRKGAYVEQKMSAQMDKLERLAALRRAK